jgi:hypothetical protein
MCRQSASLWYNRGTLYQYQDERGRRTLVSRWRCEALSSRMNCQLNERSERDRREPGREPGRFSTTYPTQSSPHPRWGAPCGRFPIMEACHRRVDLADRRGVAFAGDPRVRAAARACDRGSSGRRAGPDTHDNSAEAAFDAARGRSDTRCSRRGCCPCRGRHADHRSGNHSGGNRPRCPRRRSSRRAGNRYRFNSRYSSDGHSRDPRTNRPFGDGRVSAGTRSSLRRRHCGTVSG